MAVDSMINVLIADDQAMSRHLMTVNLSHLPGVVIVGEATDGAVAVRQAIELEPDVVLMDVGMPVMDGIAATRFIKNRKPAVRVLIVSAHDGVAFITKAIAAGADGYCLKASSTRLLHQAIRSVADGALWIDPAVAKEVTQYLGEPKKGDVQRRKTDRTGVEALKAIITGARASAG